MVFRLLFPLSDCSPQYGLPVNKTGPAKDSKADPKGIPLNPHPEWVTPNTNRPGLTRAADKLD